MLKRAVFDLSFLLTRGYNPHQGLKTVGDRYQLTSRQRKAILRASCSDKSLSARHSNRTPVQALSSATVAVDGYNTLITVETALSGGILLRCRDGVIRDIASVHGSYHRVEETIPALELTGQIMRHLGIDEAHWYFDAPVSNSGRLAALIRDFGRNRGLKWSADAVQNPDKILSTCNCIVISSDSFILDNTAAWFPLVDSVLSKIRKDLQVIDLS